MIGMPRSPEEKIMHTLNSCNKHDGVHIYLLEESCLASLQLTNNRARYASDRPASQRSGAALTLSLPIYLRHGKEYLRAQAERLSPKAG